MPETVWKKSERGGTRKKMKRGEGKEITKYSPGMEAEGKRKKHLSRVTFYK